MRAVVQRVSSARVTVDEELVAAIGPGLLVLLGVASGDGVGEAERLAERVANLRVFEDPGGRFAHSVVDAGGAVLVVSQFTLIADARKGNRPSFANAARPEEALPLVERLCDALAQRGLDVARGRFRARMAVALVNDGPVTIVLDVPAGA